MIIQVYYLAGMIFTKYIIICREFSNSAIGLTLKSPETVRREIELNQVQQEAGPRRGSHLYSMPGYDGSVVEVFR